jgi:hypothetical protein
VFTIPQTDYRGMAPDLGAKEFESDSTAIALNAVRMVLPWRTRINF